MAGKERLHGGHFPKCIVLQAIFWYLRYSPSYRDIEKLMKERGVELDYATVQRWVVNDSNPGSLIPEKEESCRHQLANG